MNLAKDFQHLVESLNWFFVKIVRGFFYNHYFSLKASSTPGCTGPAAHACEDREVLQVPQ